MIIRRLALGALIVGLVYGLHGIAKWGWDNWGIPFMLTWIACCFGYAFWYDRKFTAADLASRQELARQLERQNQLAERSLGVGQLEKPPAELVGQPRHF